MFFTSRYIKLVFWSKIENFGDLASPYLVSKLTGKKILHKDFYEGRKISFEKFWEALKKRDFMLLINNLLPWESNYVCIGSVLARGNSHSKIWGAGFRDEKDSFYGGKVYAVRGRYSAEKLVSMGYSYCDVWGDPALLIPLVYYPKIEKINKLGIIPHFKDYDAINSKYAGTKKIIDLRTGKIESVIREITSCETIISTSLHGIIVAHAYGIPAVWVEEGDVGGDGIKYKDYFSSVGIKPYQPFPIEKVIRMFDNPETFRKRFESICLPHKSLTTIQRQLLSVAPFTLKPEYRIRR